MVFLLVGQTPGKTKRPGKAFLRVAEVYAAGWEPVDAVLPTFSELAGGETPKFGSGAPQTVQTPLEKLWPVAGMVSV